MEMMSKQNEEEEETCDLTLITCGASKQVPNLTSSSDEKEFIGERVLGKRIGKNQALNCIIEKLLLRSEIKRERSCFR